MVKASAELTAKGGAKQYIYISSISAYATMSKPNADEDAELAKLEDPKVETMGPKPGTYDYYGGLKVVCEQAVSAAFPGKAAIVARLHRRPRRPDRPIHVLARTDRQGRRGADPGLARGSDPIDVRDLADWLVSSSRTAPRARSTRSGSGSGGRRPGLRERGEDAGEALWVPSEWLEKNGMGGEDAFPIWAPPTGESAGAHTWKFDRAVRPVSSSARSRTPRRQRPSGIRARSTGA